MAVGMAQSYRTSIPLGALALLRRGRLPRSSTLFNECVNQDSADRRTLSTLLPAHRRSHSAVCVERCSEGDQNEIHEVIVSSKHSLFRTTDGRMLRDPGGGTGGTS